jgi:hypothetical protein
MSLLWFIPPVIGDLRFRLKALNEAITLNYVAQFQDGEHDLLDRSPEIIQPNSVAASKWWLQFPHMELKRVDQDVGQLLGLDFGAKVADVVIWPPMDDEPGTQEIVLVVDHQTKKGDERGLSGHWSSIGVG